MDDMSDLPLELQQQIKNFRAEQCKKKKEAITSNFILVSFANENEWVDTNNIYEGHLSFDIPSIIESKVIEFPEPIDTPEKIAEIKKIIGKKNISIISWKRLE